MIRNASLILAAILIVSMGCLKMLDAKQPTPTPDAFPQNTIEEIIITQKAIPTQKFATTPPTPSFAAKRTFIAGDEQSCTRIGGAWKDVGGVWGCYLFTKDAGRKCTDSNQCEGYCISHLKGATSGLCAQTIPLQGCDYRIDNGTEKGKV
ncbi:MAG: hypothetical protein ABIG96_04515, partial [Candidatus Micrarchaeota archaeon]